MSNGFLSSGVFEFGIANLGGYEQCLRTVVRDSEERAVFKGQYCSMFLRVPKSFTKNLVEKFNKIGEMTVS